MGLLGTRIPVTSLLVLQRIHWQRTIGRGNPGRIAGPPPAAIDATRSGAEPQRFAGLRRPPTRPGRQWIRKRKQADGAGSLGQSLLQPFGVELLQWLIQRFGSEQPGRQRSPLLTWHPGPDQQQLPTRPGDCHIGQPLRLRHRSGGGLLRQLPAHPPTGIESESPAPFTGGAPQRTLHRPRGLPEVRTDHHRVFETLAAMHGDHRHRSVVLIAVGLTGLRQGLCRVKTLPAQPVGGSGDIEAMAMHRLLHQPRGLLKIPEDPAPLGEIRQTLATEQLRQTPHQPQTWQAFGPGAQLLRQPVQATVLTKVVGRFRQQRRAGQQAQAAFIPRIRQRIEQALQHHCGLALEHIPLGDQAGGNSAGPQGAAQGRGLVMTTHQQADIGRIQILLGTQQIQHQRGQLLGE